MCQVRRTPLEFCALRMGRESAATRPAPLKHGTRLHKGLLARWPQKQPLWLEVSLRCGQGS